jgi:hypothetical protein
MIAAKKSSEQFNTEMFGDVAILKRKWQAALRPGESLPRYEDVMLGSLGRLADHIALLKGAGETLAVSRTGRYVQEWLNDDRWDVPFSVLPPDCATALGKPPQARCRRGFRIWLPRIACAMAWCGPTTCWRCRHRRAGAAC